MVRALPSGVVFALRPNFVRSPQEHLEPTEPTCDEPAVAQLAAEAAAWAFGREVSRRLRRQGPLTGNILPVNGNGRTRLT